MNEEPTPTPSPPPVPESAAPVLRTGLPDELPPPRPGERHVSVPFQTIVIVADDRLRDHVNARFKWPMIILALMVLPVLAIQVIEAPEHYSPLWWVATTCMTIIWLAFFVEFVIKIMIAECRIEYVKRNWIDVIILTLPMLRPLRVTYVAKTSRVFTLRGVGMKFARYIFTIMLGLEATERLLHRFGLKTKDDRPHPDTMTRYQLKDELKKLRSLTDAWEDWYIAHQEFNEACGFQLFDEPRPTLSSQSASQSDPAIDDASDESSVESSDDGKANAVEPSL